MENLVLAFPCFVVDYTHFHVARQWEMESSRSVGSVTSVAMVLGIITAVKFVGLVSAANCPHLSWTKQFYILHFSVFSLTSVLSSFLFLGFLDLFLHTDLLLPYICNLFFIRMLKFIYSCISIYEHGSKWSNNQIFVTWKGLHIATKQHRIVHSSQTVGKELNCSIVRCWRYLAYILELL